MSGDRNDDIVLSVVTKEDEATFSYIASEKNHDNLLQPSRKTWQILETFEILSVSSTFRACTSVQDSKRLQCSAFNGGLQVVWSSSTDRIS